MKTSQTIIRLEEFGGTIYYPKLDFHKSLPHKHVKLLRILKNKSVFSIRNKILKERNDFIKDFDNIALDLYKLDLLNDDGFYEGEFLTYKNLSKEKDNVTPLRIFIELTNDCNFACQYCFVEKSNEYISVSLFKNIVEQAEDCGIINLTLTGGEPTLHKEFDELISISNASHLNMKLITNCFDVSSMIRNKRELENCTIIVSLHDSNPHNSKIFSNIRILLDLGFFVVVNVLLSLRRENFEKYLENVILDLHKIGVTETNITPQKITPYNKGDYSNNYIAFYERKISKIVNQYNSKDLSIYQKAVYCDCTTRPSIGVKVNGDIVTCGISKNQSVIENINNVSLVHVISNILYRVAERPV